MRGRLAIHPQAVGPSRDADFAEVVPVDAVEYGEVPFGFPMQIRGIGQFLIHPERKFAGRKVMLNFDFEFDCLNRNCSGNRWYDARILQGLNMGNGSRFHDMDDSRRSV